MWACAPATPVTPTDTPRPTPSDETEPPSPAPARLPTQSLSRYVPSSEFKDIGEGRTGAVLSNRRILIEGARASVIDAQSIDDLGRPQRIPESLGGGYLFVGKQTVRFSPRFDGSLDTIANVSTPKDMLEIGFGHGQILVSGEPNRPELHALPGGKKLPLPFPGTQQMFASPKGEVALVTNKGELHFSPGKGKPFKKLASSGVERLAYDGKGIVVQSGQKDERIDSSGRLVARPNEPGMVVADNLAAFTDPFPDMSASAPETPDVERLVAPLVVSMNEDVALAVREQDLLVLDGHSGKQIELKKQAFPGQTNCFPIRGGTPAFIGCNGPKEMALFRIDAIDEPFVLEKKFKGVYTHDFGEPAADAPLALARRCDGSVSPGTLCVRQKDATWKEPPKSADPAKLLAKVPSFIHVAASADGSAYAFGWLDGGGDLVVVDSKQKKVRRISKTSVPKWAENGIRWQALSIVDGKLRFLIQTSKGGNTPGILEIRADDSVDAKQLKGRLAAVDTRALLITDRGTIEETLDAGVTFHDVPLPPGGAPNSGPFACFETGCTVGPWQRVGWGP